MKKESVDLYFVPKVLDDYGISPDSPSNHSCHILFESVWPIFKFLQVIGLAPVSFDQKVICKKQSISPQKTDISQFENVSPPPVKAYTNFFSLPSLTNGILTIHLIWITIWVLINIKGLLTTWFSGTDLYTFTIQIYLYFGQTALILLNSFWRRKKLVKLWSLIDEVYQDLNSVSQEKIQPYANSLMIKYLKRLRRIGIVTIFVVLGLGILYGGYFLHFALRLCVIDPSDVRTIQLAMTRRTNPTAIKCPLENIPIFIEKLTYAAIGTYQLSLSVMFALFCFIMWIMQKEIGKQLKLIMAKRHLNDKLSQENGIEKLRISHGKLDRCCQCISDFFGLPILGSCVGSVITVTCAVYMFILGSTDLNSAGDHITSEEHSAFLRRYVFVWVFHGAFGILALTLILIAGQMVQNSAEIPIRLIGSVSHENLNDAEKYEISIFMQKQSLFKGITACNISTIGLSFLASAVTNVTTYLLVLLQFRLGVDSVDKAE